MTSAYKSIIWDSKNGILALPKEINPLIEKLNATKGKESFIKKQETNSTDRKARWEL